MNKLRLHKKHRDTVKEIEEEGPTIPTVLCKQGILDSGALTANFEFRVEWLPEATQPTKQFLPQRLIEAESLDGDRLDHTLQYYWVPKCDENDHVCRFAQSHHSPLAEHDKVQADLLL